MERIIDLGALLPGLLGNHNHAIIKIKIFELSGRMKDLEEAIQMGKLAVAETNQEDEVLLAAALSNLGNMLGQRYKRTQNLSDLEEAIHVTQQAVYTCPYGHPTHAATLNNLGNRIGLLYERTKDMEDLEESIRLATQAVYMASEGHRDLPIFLLNLGNKIESRYEHKKNIRDLKDAIEITRKASDSMPQDHDHLVNVQRALVVRLGRLYEHTKTTGDLTNTIEATRNAVNVVPVDHPEFSGFLNALGTTLCQRYDHTGKIGDLEEAIQVGRRGILAGFRDHSDFVGGLGNLALYIIRRYECMGEIEDLEEAIRIQSQAIEVTPSDHSHFAKLLHSLGYSLYRRHKRTGRMKDLEEANRLLRQAVDSTLDDHFHLAARLHSLGQTLESWYERTENLENLNEAIQVVRRAIHIMPGNHPNLADMLVDLGNVLGRRFRRTKSMGDLEEAIETARRAGHITRGNLRAYARNLGNLGRLLTNQYEHTREVEKLEEAADVTREAIDVAPDDPYLGSMLNNLGNILLHQYERKKNMEDLMEAIKVARHAIDVTPKDHPVLADFQRNLGNKLCHRYMCKGRSDDLKEAITVTQQAWNCEYAVPFVRIQSSLLTIMLFYKSGDLKSAYDLSVKAIDLLPYIHSRSLNHQDQQYVLCNFSGLAASACALALKIGESPETALELLERGRGVILGLLFDDRSDVSKLKTAHPTLCGKYETLLSKVNSQKETITAGDMQTTDTTKKAHMVHALEKCVGEIQQLPGFHQFRKGLTAKQMQTCAMGGSIVAVNVIGISNEAIIVTADSFKVLPLPNLSANQAEDWIAQKLTTTSSSDRGRKNKLYLRFLSWLWHGCVRPVLDELQYYTQPSMDDLPRVWWIGSGLASSFPFHSACDISAGPMESACYRAISSYTPTFKALQYARERAGTIPFQGDLGSAVIVAMPETPGARNLPGTRVEQSVVAAAMGMSVSVKTLEYPDVASTMGHLQACDIAHFACHGISDPADPSSSGLILQTAKTATEEPKQDILSVLKVSQAHLERASIAYLSACSTAQNQAKWLFDEGLHVVSGFQVAGFRHVVGCLWPSDDEVCVDVAKSFYAELFGEADTRVRSDRATALALHKAVTKVRENDNYRKRPLLWAQYVHFGA